MTFIPKKMPESVQQASSLQKFRAGPLYKALMRKRTKGSTILVQSLKQTYNNLVERARGWVILESAKSDAFSTALIARLVDAGLDRALVEVLDGKSGSCIVYFSDRLGRLSKEIPNIIAEIGEAELQQSPNDSDESVYVYRMVAKAGVNLQEFMQKLLGKTISKNESVQVDPFFKPFKRK